MCRVPKKKIRKNRNPPEIGWWKLLRIDTLKLNPTP